MKYVSWDVLLNTSQKPEGFSMKKIAFASLVALPLIASAEALSVQAGFVETSEKTWNVVILTRSPAIENFCEAGSKSGFIRDRLHKNKNLAQSRTAIGCWKPGALGRIDFRYMELDGGGIMNTSFSANQLAPMLWDWKEDNLYR